jgi:hypothetical protein
MSLVKGGSNSIRINDETSSYFHLGRGSPIPLMFNLVVDVFSECYTRQLVKGTSQASSPVCNKGGEGHKYPICRRYSAILEA